MPAAGAPRSVMARVRYLSTEVAGGFTGVHDRPLRKRVNGYVSGTPADFAWFSYSVAATNPPTSMKHPVLLLITLLGMLASLCQAAAITPQTALPVAAERTGRQGRHQSPAGDFCLSPVHLYQCIPVWDGGGEAGGHHCLYFDQLKLDYTTEMGRRLQEDLFEYDVVQTLGYVTPAQRQTLLDRTVDQYQIPPSPRFPPQATDFTNLGQEKVCALGLAALNFPDHPDAQTWYPCFRAVDRSIHRLLFS